MPIPIWLQFHLLFAVVGLVGFLIRLKTFKERSSRHQNVLLIGAFIPVFNLLFVVATFGILVSILSGKNQ